MAWCKLFVGVAFQPHPIMAGPISNSLFSPSLIRFRKFAASECSTTRSLNRSWGQFRPSITQFHVCFWGNGGHDVGLRRCPLMTQSGHQIVAVADPLPLLLAML